MFRQEETSLAFVGLLDQPLALGSFSYTLPSSLPRWKRAELVASAVYLGLHLEGFIREDSGREWMSVRPG